MVVVSGIGKVLFIEDYVTGDVNFVGEKVVTSIAFVGG